jgi:hypothetical protein
MPAKPTVPKELIAQKWGQTLTLPGGEEFAAVVKRWAKRTRLLKITVAGDAVTIIRASREDEDEWIDRR